MRRFPMQPPGAPGIAAPSAPAAPASVAPAAAPVAAPAPALPPPFVAPGTPPNYAPPRATDLLHMRLQIALDFVKHSFSGVETLSFTALPGGTDRLLLDSESCVIKSVRAVGANGQAGAALPHTLADKKLSVTLPRRLAPGQKMTLQIAYDGTARGGREGLHFVGPYPGYPERIMVWSQGETDNNHHWFPTWDHPDDKLSSELLVTVPARMKVVSNGRLLGVSAPSGKGADATRMFHWKQESPHSTYLVSVIAADLAEIKDRAGRVPLSYFVPVGREADARRTFGETPQMMALFERLLGVPYPWAKYAQTACWEFGGGMENTSATTMGEHILVRAGEEADRDSSSIIAHELAHQWFGDLITSRDWGDIWLNESFATYFDMLYAQASRGQDAYVMQLRGAREGYLREVARVRRPVATTLYPSPDAMFGSGTTYSKGGYLLHTLRERMGDTAFFGGLREFLKRRAYAPAETADLRRALEEYSGQSLGDWFDERILRPGHTELKIEPRWDEAVRTLSLTLSQTQPTSDGTPLGRGPLQLMFRVGGQTVEREIAVRSASETFVLPLPAAPEMMIVDPRHRWLMTLDMARTTAQWIAQLQHGPDAWWRTDAAQSLSGVEDDAARAALRAALSRDPSPRVRSEAAAALTAVRRLVTLEDRDALVAALRAGAPSVAANTSAAARLQAANRRSDEGRAHADLVSYLGRMPDAMMPVPLLRESVANDSSQRARGAAFAGAL